MLAKDIYFIMSNVKGTEVQNAHAVKRRTGKALFKTFRAS